MTSPDGQSVTALLQDLRDGRAEAFDALLPLVYEELRERARRQRLQWHGDHTMNTTALVHEAYLKLVGQEGAGWQSRAHFLSVAAQAMRHILVDYAKRRRAQKRGGGQEKVPLDDVIVLSEARAEELIDLDAALSRLAAFDERQSRVVECRFFGGMTIDETAAVLGISTATVTRDWRMAQTWLYRELQHPSKSQS